MKDTRKEDNVLPKTQDSVVYAKEGKKKPKAKSLIQSRVGKVKFCVAAGNSECCRGCGEKGTLLLLVGMQTSTATMENSVEIP